MNFVEKGGEQTAQGIESFSGIGAYEEALRNLGVDHEIVAYCEIKNFASKSYSILNNVSESKNLGDIREVRPESIEDFDLMTYSSPCQDVSSLGSKRGIGSETRTGLAFKAIEIAKHKRPKYMVAENVTGLLSKKFSEGFEELKSLLSEAGYNTYVSVMNAKDYGIPQSRRRVFLVSIRKDVDDGSFRFPEKATLNKTACDFIDYESKQDPILYARESDQKYYNDYKLKKRYSSLDANVLICMTTKQGSRSNPQNFVTDAYGTRILTAKEMLVLQGFNGEHANTLISNGITAKQIGYMTGNSITVTKLEAIFKNLLRDYL